MMSQPLRMRPDYGERAGEVNPYLNTPPTELKRDMAKEKDPEKRSQMQDALDAWRLTVPGPFSRASSRSVRTLLARELLRVARLVGRV